MTDYSKGQIATEVAFQSLIDAAGNTGLHPQPVMGLMYLPDAKVTQQFKEACRAVLESLGCATIEPSQP